jgi:hypothetical protein
MDGMCVRLTERTHDTLHRAAGRPLSFVHERDEGRRAPCAQHEGIGRQEKPEAGGSSAQSAQSYRLLCFLGWLLLRQE